MNQKPVEQQVYFEIKPENVRKCLKMFNTADQAIQNEVRMYLDNCEKNPNLSYVLLDLFNNNNEELDVRHLSLIYFKNVVQRHWATKRPNARNQIYINDDIKTAIRKFLPDFLTKHQVRMFRSQIDDAIRIISKTDYPESFVPLFEYFVSNLKDFNTLIASKNAPDFLSDVVFNFFQTLNLVTKEAVKRRTRNTKDIFYNYYVHILAEFSKIWSTFNSNFKAVLENVIKSNNENNLERFMRLVRFYDKIIINLLLCGFDEIHLDESATELMKMILQKACDYLKILKNFENKTDKIAFEMNKNLKNILILLSHLQNTFPFLFAQVLNDYMQLCQITIENSNWFLGDSVLKAGMLGLYKILKMFSYYTNPETFQQTSLISQKQKSNVEAQSLCYQQFVQFFSEKSIESFFNTFVLKILPTSKDRIITEETVHNLVEGEVETYLDDTLKEIDNTLFNICLATIECFLNRFPSFCVKLIHTLANKALETSLTELPGIYQDCIFALVGLLPTIYEKFKVPQENYMNIIQAIKYLNTNVKNYQMFGNRIPVLLGKWLKLMSGDMMSDLALLLLGLIENNSSNFLIRYESLVCLKNIIKIDSELKIDYMKLLHNLVPVVLNLLEKHFSSNIIWPLISLINDLMKKAQYTVGNEELVAAFHSESFKKLLGTNSDILKTALVETFKNLIVSFEPGDKIPSIFLLALEFVDLGLKRNVNDSNFLRLWIFLSKEYTYEQGLNDAMKNLFLKNYESLNNTKEMAITTMFIELIEEYVLLNFLDSNLFGKLIQLAQEKYDQTKGMELSEPVVELRTAVLGLMMTILLTYLNNKQPEALVEFERLLEYSVLEIMTPIIDKSMKGVSRYRTAIITILNRFLISEPEKILLLIKTAKINILDFIDNWMTNMEFIASYASRRINAIAILQVIQFIDDTVYFKQRFSYFVRWTLPEVTASIENASPGKTPNKFKSCNRLIISQFRLNDYRTSDRKDELRKTQLFDNLNLKDLFVTRMKEAFVKHGFDELTIGQLINDESKVQNLFSVLQN